MPMQPQKPPRGVAGDVAEVIAKAIDRENKRRRGRLNVSHILRALEWTRYMVTEACVNQNVIPKVH